MPSSVVLQKVFWYRFEYELGKKNVSEEESWQSWTISWTYEMHLKRHIIEKKTKNGDEL